MKTNAPIFIACVALALAACSGGNEPQTTLTATNPAVAVAPSGSACDRKLIGADDVSPLLSAPVATTKNIPGDPSSCSFTTADFSSVTIALRPGHGKSTLATYTSGKMDDYDKSVPLTGVGDEAVRSVDINRVTARKGDLLCEITGPGLASATDAGAAVKLGALCNKIFAAN